MPTMNHSHLCRQRRLVRQALCAKVAVLAAAAELLRLAGEFLDGVVLLSGYGKESLTTI